MLLVRAKRIGYKDNSIRNSISRQLAPKSLKITLRKWQKMEETPNKDYILINGTYKVPAPDQRYQQLIARYQASKKCRAEKMTIKAYSQQMRL